MADTSPYTREWSPGRSFSAVVMTIRKSLSFIRFRSLVKEKTEHSVECKPIDVVDTEEALSSKAWVNLQQAYCSTFTNIYIYIYLFISLSLHLSHFISHILDLAYLPNAFKLSLCNTRSLDSIHQLDEQQSLALQPAGEESQKLLCRWKINTFDVLH